MKITSSARSRPPLSNFGELSVLHFNLPSTLRQTNGVVESPGPARLRNFVRTGHIGSFRSIGGEGKGSRGRRVVRTCSPTTRAGRTTRGSRPTSSITSWRRCLSSGCGCTSSRAEEMCARLCGTYEGVGKAPRLLACGPFVVAKRPRDDTSCVALGARRPVARPSGLILGHAGPPAGRR